MPTALQRIARRFGFVPAGQVRAAELAAAARVQAQASRQQRSLLAALTTNDIASWQADGSHVNTETAAGLAVVRARSRDAAHNNEFAKRFIGMVRSNVLGPLGVRHQSRVRTAGGQLKTSVNERLEAAWSAWCRRGNCEVSGRYTWLAVQRLVLRHVVVDGELLIRFVRGRGPHKLQLQLMPADVLPINHNADLGGGTTIRQGVETNAEGKVLAYHLRTDATTGDILGGYRDLTRVPADDILHIMLPDQVQQLRGVPWMATALKRMYQAADFAGSGLNKARESAKRGGWFSQDPEAAPPPQMQDGKDENGTPYQTLQDGTWETLPAGLIPKPYESDFPNIEYGQFIKDCVRGIASALDVAYITLGNDLEAVNYSSGQLGLEGERTMWLALQQWFIESMVDPVHRMWLRYSLVAVPELGALGFDKLDAYADAARWQAHRWQPLDPLKTIEAQRSRIEARLTSPQRVIAETGEDPDEIVAELLEWQEKTAGLKSPEGPRPAVPGGAAGEPGDGAAAQANARAALRLQLIRSLD